MNILSYVLFLSTKTGVLRSYQLCIIYLQKIQMSNGLPWEGGLRYFGHKLEKNTYP